MWQLIKDINKVNEHTQTLFTSIQQTTYLLLLSSAVDLFSLKFNWLWTVFISFVNFNIRFFRMFSKMLATFYVKVIGLYFNFSLRSPDLCKVVLFLKIHFSRNINQSEMLWVHKLPFDFFFDNSVFMPACSRVPENEISGI